MPKLSKEHKFLDLSDYGRPIARLFANSLKNTAVTPLHVTFCFLAAGLLAAFYIFSERYLLAGICLVVKSILDAADGELARAKQKPSLIGRFLDSILDLLLNLLILTSICLITNGSLLVLAAAFFSIQLQGTVFNYYYTILRNRSEGGDTTSRIEERGAPQALHGESQKMVNFLFAIYRLLYGIFDEIMLALDGTARQVKILPGWFLTLVSVYGLGFQLLIIAIMLNLSLDDYVLAFFNCYSVLIVVIVGTRKICLR